MNTTVRNVAALMMALGMAGCAGEEEPVASQAASPPEADVGTLDPPSNAQQAVTPLVLPGDVEIRFPHHVRADRDFENNAGVPRRRIVLEFLEGDAQSIDREVRDAFVGAGFNARAPEQMPDGNIRANYGKPDFGAVRAVIHTTPGDKAVHPNAKGVVSLDFPRGTASNQVSADE